MFKKTPSKLCTKDYDSTLVSKLEKLYRLYKMGMPNKEEKCRKLWAQITNEGFDDNGKPIPARNRILKAISNEKGPRLVCAMLQANVRQVSRRKEEKISIEEAQLVFEGLRGDNNQFTFEQFKEGCQYLCMPLVIFMGAPQSGKKTIFNRLISEAFTPADDKVRCSYIFSDIEAHPLQIVATVIIVIPIFSFKASAGTEVAKFWDQIHKASSAAESEPTVRHMHFFFNWESHEVQEQLLQSFPLALLTPAGEKVGDINMNKPGPKYKYMQERTADQIRNEIEGCIVECHTLYNEVTSVKEAWLDMHHFSIKANPSREQQASPVDSKEESEDDES